MPILSFLDPEIEVFFRTGVTRQWTNIAKVMARKLDMLSAAVILDDLRIPPGNRLEALKHDRRGQHSIRINNQFRICFVWTDNGPVDVEVVDYH